jgi:psiF repeat-containing protein
MKGHSMMFRFIIASGLVSIAFAATPALAVTAKEKMETCKFGADDQKLAGTARKSFMTKCMANSDAPVKQAKPKAAKPKPQT